MFWSYHKAILHHRSATNPVITFNNDTATSPKKSRTLQYLFLFCFSAAKPTEINEPPCYLLTADLPFDITISEEEVVHHLSNLDPSNAPGPDNIPGHLFLYMYIYVAITVTAISRKLRC